MKFHENKEDDLGINLTPLIDVVFLLLIFFMVSTTFEKESKLQIRLPEATTKESLSSETEFLEVQIGGDGQFAIKSDGTAESLTLLNNDLETIQRAMADNIRDASKTVVIIRADRQAIHEHVVRTMDAARRLELLQVTFATRKVE